jgi:hypothetical protein
MNTVKLLAGACTAAFVIGICDIAFCMRHGKIPTVPENQWGTTSRAVDSPNVLDYNLISGHYKRGAQYRLVGDIKKLNGESLLQLLYSRTFLNMLKRTDVKIIFKPNACPPKEQKIPVTDYIFKKISKAELIPCMQEIEEHCAEYATFSYDKENNDDAISLTSIESTRSIKLINDDPRTQYVNYGDTFLDKISLSLPNFLQDELPPEAEITLSAEKPYKYEDIVSILNKYPQYAEFFWENREKLKIMRDDKEYEPSSEAMDMIFMECALPIVYK